MVAQDVKYLFFLVEELVADLAGRALFYGSAHASERGRGQGQGLVLDQVAHHRIGRERFPQQG